MGILQSQPKPEEQLKFELDNRFEIVFKKITENSLIWKQDFDDIQYGKVDILQNNYLKDYFLVLKDIIYTSEYEATHSLAMFQNRALQILHPNLIQLQTCSYSKIENFCSSLHTNSLLFDHIQKTLEDELLQIKSFSEEDIWFLLDSLIGALSFLQTKGLQHQDLRFSNIYLVNTPQNLRLFKLADQELMRYEGIYQYAFENYNKSLNMKGIYLSPEQLMALKQKNKNPTYNHVCSDVFTCGMLIAQLCLWRHLDDIYDYSDFRINQELLQNIIIEISQRYSQDLVRILKEMLNLSNRVDFTTLNKLLDSNPNLVGKRIINHISNHSLSIVLQLPEDLKIDHQKIKFQQQQIEKQQKKYQESLVINPYDQMKDDQTLKEAKKQESAPLMQKLESTVQPLMYYQQSQQQQQNGYPDGVLGVSMRQDPMLAISKALVNQLMQNPNLIMQLMNPQAGYPQAGYVQPQSDFQSQPIQQFQTISQPQIQASEEIKYPDGSRYSGPVKDNKREGQGVFYSPDGRLAYEGNFYDDKFEGFGKIFNNNFRIQLGQIDYKDFGTLNGDWMNYEGDFKRGKKDGYGILNFGNKDSFIGNFYDGRVNGYGTINKPDGSLINGYWENDKLIRII